MITALLSQLVANERVEMGTGQKFFYIFSFVKTSCHSPVGMSGVNRISLQTGGCQNKGTILHEIGHSIGR